MSQTYDYVIVGGGTAGLTVAARLSEDPNVSVLVIEAGGNNVDDPLTATPGFVGAMYGKDKYDWNFSTEPQPERNNRKISQPRGRMLGGSSGLNFCMLLHPTRQSLDCWAELGNEGWDYNSVEPYFRKFSKWHTPLQATKDQVHLKNHDESRESDGPIQVSFGTGYKPTNGAWMETFANLGLESTVDMRTGDMMGAFQQPASIDPKTNTRSYSATAYYSPEIQARKNLTVVTDTTVKKIEFDTSGDEPVATGVLAEAQGGSDVSYRAGEVLLAAGALQSPQLLELSGIGGKELLEKHGIPVIVDNKWVGENLQDHPLACQSFEVADGVHSDDVARDPNVMKAVIDMYQASGEGPLGQSNISVAYMPLADDTGVLSREAVQAWFAENKQHIKTEDDHIIKRMTESLTEPPVEYMLFPFQVNTNFQAPEHLGKCLETLKPENYITIMTILNHPFSRGYIHIVSPDIHKKPIYEPKYGANPLDTLISAKHVQFIEKIIHTEPFSKLLKPDGARIPNIKGDTLENAIEVLRESEVSVFHPTGSCGMRPRDKQGVVDSHLRVYGVKGLRVVDASVMPIEPVGNIQSVVYAVAEKAADIIKQDRQ